MKRIVLALAFLVGSIASAAAACTSPAVMHDFPGTAFNMSLATVPDGNCGSNVGVPSWAGGTLGAMATYGTSPGAVPVPGMNAFVTNIPAVTQSGTWTSRVVGNAGGVFDGATAAAVPANALYLGINSGGNLAGWTGAVSQAGTWNVTNVSGTVSLPTGAATAALQPTNAAQASATSGQTGTLVECAVTSSAPTYTTAQTNPVSCDTAGNMRVTVTNANPNGQAAKTASSPVVIASDQSQVPVDAIVTPSNAFTRPANVTAYASGQLVANSTTAGSVVPLSWTSAARVSGGNFYIRRVRMTLSSKSVTLTSFRIHFYTVTPTIANGDGAAWSTTLANYVCKMDVPVASWEAGTDVSIGFGLPTSGDGNECNVVASAQTLFALVEARAAYVPASGETITVIPEIHQN